MGLPRAPTRGLIEVNRRGESWTRYRKSSRERSKLKGVSRTPEMTLNLRLVQTETTLDPFRGHVPTSYTTGAYLTTPLSAIQCISLSVTSRQEFELASHIDTDLRTVSLDFKTEYVESLTDVV
ncbi:hypothetical protein KIN20_017000 [Parelaphostrongylus tenuis]|uniref:Uncharacterized protein n=1 Tax=Parelaphostrongylus tenuis TaxID=148309 RepID=A0AAD5MI02_PARTN|nr:hypothetical protein KIN20_017000 [Parelaphostrongylus tenuis]